MKLVVLLYADDTDLFAECEDKLQQLLNEFQSYCVRWNLNVNPEKSKIVVFGHRSRQRAFSLNEQPIEVVDNFKYLGVLLLTQNKKFFSNKKTCYRTSKKTLFWTLSKNKKLRSPY